MLLRESPFWQGAYSPNPKFTISALRCTVVHSSSRGLFLITPRSFLQNVFVEAVRAVVSPVTLRTAKENRKHLWNKVGLGDGRRRRRKVCALM